jgi:hypothetical protein
MGAPHTQRRAQRFFRTGQTRRVIHGCFSSPRQPQRHSSFSNYGATHALPPYIGPSEVEKHRLTFHVSFKDLHLVMQSHDILVHGFKTVLACSCTCQPHTLRGIPPTPHPICLQQALPFAISAISNGHMHCLGHASQPAVETD